jgi:hypothetical protein
MTDQVRAHIIGVGTAVFGVPPSSKLASMVPASAELAMARAVRTAADHPERGD